MAALAALAGAVMSVADSDPAAGVMLVLVAGFLLLVARAGWRSARGEQQEPGLRQEPGRPWR
ncbi:hypothetical protein STBA_11280 [Streptomyces sp. MP131-18]|nr:hypothetical protein STBA_11280 [Streptomyces sp. MP131-18]